MSCNCACHNITDTDDYIDLYNTTLALEIVQGQIYTLLLPINTDITTLTFESQYFTGDFIKEDNGRWTLTMNASDTANIPTGIYPYVVKANGTYLYSGTMNVIDSSSSIESEDNPTSTINNFNSPRYIFEFRNQNKYTVTRDGDTIRMVYTSTKKNQDVLEALTRDLVNAETDKRLMSVRFALVKPVDGNLEPYSITQDIEFESDKITAEYYYVDDYVDGCSHLLFEFTNESLTISATFAEEYFDDGGTAEKFGRSIMNLLTEYKMGEFTIIEKKSADDPAYSCDLVAGSGISISWDGVISTDFDDKSEEINSRIDSLESFTEESLSGVDEALNQLSETTLQRIDDVNADITSRLDSCNHLYKSEGSRWESGDGYLIGYKYTNANIAIGKIELGFERANAYFPYRPNITATTYDGAENTFTTTVNFNDTINPFITMKGTGTMGNMGQRNIYFDAKWYDDGDANNYSIKIPAARGATLATNIDINELCEGYVLEVKSSSDLTADSIDLYDYVDGDSEDEKTTKVLDLVDSIVAGNGGFTLKWRSDYSNKVNSVHYRKVSAQISPDDEYARIMEYIFESSYSTATINRTSGVIVFEHGKSNASLEEDIEALKSTDVTLTDSINNEVVRAKAAEEQIIQDTTDSFNAVKDELKVMNEEIESAGKIDDVQVNGASVVIDKVANLDMSGYATTATTDSIKNDLKNNYPTNSVTDTLSQSINDEISNRQTEDTAIRTEMSAKESELKSLIDSLTSRVAELENALNKEY